MKKPIVINCNGNTLKGEEKFEKFKTLVQQIEDLGFENNPAVFTENAKIDLT